jgi:hypothetical protein
MGLDLDNLFRAREVLSDLFGKKWGKRLYHGGVFLCFLALVAVSLTTLFHFTRGTYRQVTSLVPSHRKEASVPRQEKPPCPPWDGHSLYLCGLSIQGYPNSTAKQNGIGLYGGAAEVETHDVGIKGMSGDDITVPAGSKLKLSKTNLADSQNGVVIRDPSPPPPPVVGTISGGNNIVAPNATAPITQNNYGPPHDANGLYQGDRKIGNAQIMSQSADNLVLVAHFTDVPDPVKLIEYAGAHLHCANLPTRESNSFGGWEATVAGLKCTALK